MSRKRTRSETANEQLVALIKEHWAWHMADTPEFSTFFGMEEHNDRLDDHSLEAWAAREAKNAEFLSRAQEIDEKQLSEDNRLNCVLLRKMLTDMVEGLTYKGYLMPLNSMEGPQDDFVNLIGFSKFETEKQYLDYVRRLELFSVKIDQIITLLRTGVTQKIVMPKICIQAIPSQLESHLSIAPEDTVFYKPLLEKQMSQSRLTSDAVRSQVREQALAAIRNGVQPALGRLRDYVRDEYMQACTEEISASKRSLSPKYYELLIRYHTTVPDLTAQKVHDIGLEEVKRIRSEMQKVLDQVQFQGTIEQFVEQLRKDPQFYYTDEERLLNDYRALCKRIEPELMRIIGLFPRTPYRVTPTPSHSAETAPAAFYYAGSSKSRRPGAFYVNTSHLHERPNYEMEALALHEAVPGHHLQQSLQDENPNLPEFRQTADDRMYYQAPGRYPIYTAYVEGWGLYSEYLGKELGFYQSPYSYFGRLSMEMMRASRLVLDTGMHALGWSVERAIQFMRDNTAMSEVEVKAEVIRYVSIPGQALGYKIGEIKLRELRQKAETQLGANFDVREFHDLVLGVGAVPLDVLETLVDQLIARRR